MDSGENMQTVGEKSSDFSENVEGFGVKFGLVWEANSKGGSINKERCTL